MLYNEHSWLSSVHNTSLFLVIKPKTPLFASIHLSLLISPFVAPIFGAVSFKLGASVSLFKTHALDSKGKSILTYLSVHSYVFSELILNKNFYII